jgi:hypothetical protein
MGTHFYKFTRAINGNLLFQGKYDMKYFDVQVYGILIKDTDIDSVKDTFLVNKTRVVKSGKTWLSNHLLKINKDL